MATSERVTEMLSELTQGGDQAAEQLMPLVYEELRALARRYMADEQSAHTLQTTALIHEAYLRLAGHSEPAWESRAHFFRVAARAMRRVLIDHARQQRGPRKGGDARRVPFDDEVLAVNDSMVDLLELEDALEKLSALDGQLAQIVELRFFGGLTVEEVARMLKISPRTVKRDWRLAKSWLHRAMSGDAK